MDESTWPRKYECEEKRMQNLGANRLTYFLLLVIVCLQLWIAIRPAVSVTPVKAASSVAQYKVVQVYDPQWQTVSDPAVAEKKINDVAKDGWTLVDCPDQGQCIFKK
jgi:hypothetical protein